MFSKNIKYLRLKKGYSQQQLADKIGCTNTAVSQWERQRTSGNKPTPIPNITTLNKIAEIFDIETADDLVFADIEARETQPQESARKYKKIKVYGSITAGLPNEMFDDVIGEEDIPQSWEKGGKEFFALRISGDSMTPDYLDGDIVIVRKACDCESGDDCVVSIGSEATFKRVEKENGAVILRALNPKYKTQIFNGSQEDPPINILGVVVELRRTIK